MFSPIDNVNFIKPGGGQQQSYVPQKRSERLQVTGYDEQKRYDEQNFNSFHTIKLNELSKRLDSIEKEIERLSYQFSIQMAVINTLGGDRFELKMPLNINIEHRAIDDFVACLYDADLYGYGESIPEAIGDLKSAIIDQFEYLQEQEKTIELSIPLKKQLMFLNDILVNKNV